MEKLKLSNANKIITAALTKARELSLAPLAVVVLDEGGYLKASQREDGASFLRPQIALAKAWSAVSMNMASRELGELAAQRPAFMNALLEVANGKFMPVPGGVLIRSAAGDTLGAVGISGDVSDQDEACAIAGIRAVNLIAGGSGPGNAPPAPQ